MADFASGLSQLDADQITRKLVTTLSSGDIAQKVAVVGGSLVPDQYDQISLTYVVSGPGAGQIETVTYKYQGTTIRTLTLSYDVSDKLIDVLRS